MGLMDALKATGRGIGRLPRIIGDAEYEHEPVFQYPTIPSMPTQGQVTPDGPVYDMDMGGGQESTPRQIGERRTGLSGFGRAMRSLPGMIGAGIAGAATENVAGGGPTDVFRAMQAGGNSVEAKRHRDIQQARQAQKDTLDAQHQRALIEQEQARADELRAHAQQRGMPPAARAATRPMNAEQALTQQYVNEQDPQKKDELFNQLLQIKGRRGPGVGLDAKQGAQLAVSGGKVSPETEDYSIPSLAPVGPAMTGSIGNIPPPDGYNAVPGTSGDQRVVVPSLEYKHEIGTQKPSGWTKTVGADGSVVMQRVDADGQAEEVPLEAKGKPVRVPAGRAGAKQSLQQKNAEYRAEGIKMNLQGADLDYYTANHRLPTPRGKGGFDAKSTAEAIAAAMGGGKPATAPAPSGKTSSAAPPAEFAARMPVGKNVRFQIAGAPDQMWVKNPDGTLKRLR